MEFTAIGFGTAPLGGFRAPVSEDGAAAAIEAALETGYRYFDTAPMYGYGLAERRLGQALTRIVHGVGVCGGARPRKSLSDVG